MLRVRFPSLTPQLVQRRRRVVSIGKMSVSKTEVFSSNLNAPAKFSLKPLREEKRDFFPPHKLPLILEGKPNRYGSSPENGFAQKSDGSTKAERTWQSFKERPINREL